MALGFMLLSRIKVNSPSPLVGLHYSGLGYLAFLPRGPWRRPFKNAGRAGKLQPLTYGSMLRRLKILWWGSWRRSVSTAMATDRDASSCLYLILLQFLCFHAIFSSRRRQHSVFLPILSLSPITLPRTLLRLRLTTAALLREVIRKRSTETHTELLRAASSGFCSPDLHYSSKRLRVRVRGGWQDGGNRKSWGIFGGKTLAGGWGL